MPPHVLPEGRLLIDGLSRLGEALAYQVEPERVVGGGGAAVDLAWYSAGDNSVPLMIFEVESSASSSMANNAMKVLSQDVDEFNKPLFFFHLLLTGGPDNDRIKALRRQWGNHNYKVYRMNAPQERERLLIDVLRQHRRVSASITASHLNKVLTQEPWIGIGRDAIFQEAENLGFTANFLGDYARSALDDPRMLHLYLRRLDEELSGAVQVTQSSYGSFLGEYMPAILELALLISRRILSDDTGAARLEQWQESSNLSMRMIGPYFGLNQNYDYFVLGSAPFLYAMVGVLLRESPKSLIWVISDLASIVQEERTNGVYYDYLALPLIWLAHLSATALGRLDIVDTEREHLVAHYDFARTALNDQGGISQDVLDSPPTFIPMDEPDEWITRLNSPNRAHLPPWQELNSRYEAEIDPKGGKNDYSLIAVSAFVSEEWTTWDGRELVVALRKP